MNAWKNHKLSFLLAGGSLFLLLLFQVFWLNNTYQNEKENLREKADLIFEDAVRSVEDSLFQSFIFDPAMMAQAIDTQIIVNKSKNNFRSFIPKIKLLENDTSINFQIDMRTDFRKERKKNSFGSIALWMSRDSVVDHLNHPDSVFFNNNNFTIIKEKLDHLMTKSGLPTPYEVLILEKDEIPKGDLYSNAHTDVLSEKSYMLFFPNYKNHLLQKIFSQLLFSIFLFGAILFSFFMVWQSLEKQRRLTELKNDFISNVTHELKTPITTVGVALEALSSFNALQNPQRTEEYLNISKHELQRLSILVDKVLKMSLFEKKEPELKLETFDMQELIHSVLRSMKLQFEKFSAKVNIDFEGANFAIKGDKIHLTNVVYNLIDNALKYSVEKPEINLLLKQNDHQLELIIQDKGIGIEKDLISKIFEKFFRVPQGNQHDIKGYGLGLSYVAGVIKKHQGKIEVNSQINKGTAFTISLPKNHE